LVPASPHIIAGSIASGDISIKCKDAPHKVRKNSKSTIMDIGGDMMVELHFD
jgi:hypothetical protein